MLKKSTLERMVSYLEKLGYHSLKTWMIRKKRNKLRFLLEEELGLRLKHKEVDGSYFYAPPRGRFPGVATQVANLETTARDIAVNHFDDPVIVTVKVPPGIVDDGHIFNNYVDAFVDENVAVVAMGEVNKLARADINPLYPDMEEGQITPFRNTSFWREGSNKTANGETS